VSIILRTRTAVAAADRGRLARRAGRIMVVGMHALPAFPGLEVTDQQRVWNGRFPLDVIRFRHRRFDGAMSGERTWELWRRGPAAAALPYDPVTDAVVLIEQFRLPALAAGLDPVLIELPAGLADAGEAAETTVRRETQEETGLQVGRLEKIGDFLLSAGGSDERCALFVAELRLPADAGNSIGHGGLASEDEDIRVRVWPAEAAIAAVMAGGVANSVAAIGLLWLATQRPRLRAEWSQP
jgi:ADP-ribose pyrophosphatase